MGRITDRRRIVHLEGGAAVERFDTLVAEEPLEIRVAGTPIAVTMRTPGDDFDLVSGFTFTEGIVTSPGQLSAMRYCAGADADGRNTYNVIDVVLTDDAPPIDTSVGRNFYTTSSCGVCGKASIDAVRVRSPFDLNADHVIVTPSVLSALPQKLREAQKIFASTGGLHAAALFSPDGEMLTLREDVGRHNAVDKVVGWAARENRLPLAATVLMVSGRVSFELVQKAYVAGIPVLAAVSAPSTLAAEFAQSVGMTLVGFLRGESMNVYTMASRVRESVTA